MLCVTIAGACRSSNAQMGLFDKRPQPEQRSIPNNEVLGTRFCIVSPIDGVGVGDLIDQSFEIGPIIFSHAQLKYHARDARDTFFALFIVVQVEHGDVSKSYAIHSPIEV